MNKEQTSMYFYYLMIRIAAYFGHRKARQITEGQRGTKVREGRLTVNGLIVARGAVWIHAASVGEFEQARPIIERLRREQPNQRIVVSFFSPSGYEMRKDYDLADVVFYLPLGTRRTIRRFLEALQPKMALFIKYEFWPSYLKELKRLGIPTYSICSIFREKQVFFRWWGKPMLRVLHCFTHLCVQDEESRALLEHFGVTKVSIVGDTRFDRMKTVSENQSAMSDKRLAPIEQFIAGSERVIVAGSTWATDAALLAQYTERLNDRDEQVKMIIVPHEITEEQLHAIFKSFKGRFMRYSTIGSEGMANIAREEHLLQHVQVLVVDTMGLLSSIYRLGCVAYIGGGFGAGIHNTIEAASYGMPVVFGPNYHQFREAERLIAVGAARSINNAEELDAAFTTALDQHGTIGANAAQYVQSELGATDRIWNTIFGNHKS